MAAPFTFWEALRRIAREFYAGSCGSLTFAIDHGLMTTTLATPHAEATKPHRLTGRDRRRAVASLPELKPGRYLAVHVDDEVIVLRLEKASVRLGRSLGSDIHFDDATISRRHAMVLQRDEATLLVDDRSTNGTWLNGERVREAALRHGDTIVLGDIRIDYLEVTPQRPDTTTKRNHHEHAHS